jgi:hypothetical protein
MLRAVKRRQPASADVEGNGLDHLVRMRSDAQEG